MLCAMRWGVFLLFAACVVRPPNIGAAAPPAAQYAIGLRHQLHGVLTAGPALRCMGTCPAPWETATSRAPTDVRPLAQLVMVAFVVLLLPETKGQDLEHTFKAFQTHWFWSRHSDIGRVHIEEWPLKGRSLKAGVAAAAQGAGAEQEDAGREH